MQPGIFESLQQKIDEDGAVREVLHCTHHVAVTN